MEATKVKGILNEKGELIIEDKINLSAGNVEILILKTDNLNQINTKNKLSINQEEKKINKPIWEIAENLIEDMSEEEKAEMPRDGALEHDHYIYEICKINNII